MADETSDIGMDPNISEDEDSDDEVSLLVVDEDELQTALETAGISIKVNLSLVTSAVVDSRRCTAQTALRGEHVASCWAVGPLV